MSDTPPPPRRRGCLFYGCIVGIVAMVAILTAFLLGLHQFKRMLNQYTDTAPVPLPTVHMSASEFEDIQDRVDAFSHAVQAERPTPPLALTADEINALIASNKNLALLKGKLYVTIASNQLQGQFSWPMVELGLPIFKKRYLNGTGALSVGMRDGRLVVTLHDVMVKGKRLPPVYMEKIRGQNLAQNINADSRLSTGLERLRDVTVKDGKLLLVPKDNQ